MELIRFGNLRHVRIARSETRQLLRQGLEALHYLHTKGITHRDIKPENILIFSRVPLNIKLGDFGLSKDASVLKSYVGTNGYVAREIDINGQNQYTHAVDIWSLAAVVLESWIGPGSLPHSVKDMNNCKELVDVVERLTKQKPGDPVLKILSSMLRMEPQERLSTAEYLTAARRLDSASLHYSGLSAITAIPGSKGASDDWEHSRKSSAVTATLHGQTQRPRLGMLRDGSQNPSVRNTSTPFSQHASQPKPQPNLSGSLSGASSGGRSFRPSLTQPSPVEAIPRSQSGVELYVTQQPVTITDGAAGPPLPGSASNSGISSMGSGGGTPRQGVTFPSELSDDYWVGWEERSYEGSDEA
ncbi:MAG: hypothetical protein M1837_001875 [Sclerophora amabilis]|nr:MAG: hypothetical protein M1837_001875 [Sclerophora amabilis]